MSVLISRKTKKKIKAIFEHPNDIYSVYFKETDDVKWVNSKIELYNYLKTL